MLALWHPPVDYLLSPDYFRFDVAPDCSVELSPLGYQFFTDIFETFDKVIYVVVGPSDCANFP